MALPEIVTAVRGASRPVAEGVATVVPDVAVPDADGAGARSRPSGRAIARSGSVADDAHEPEHLCPARRVRAMKRWCRSRPACAIDRGEALARVPVSGCRPDKAHDVWLGSVGQLVAGWFKAAWWNDVRWCRRTVCRSRWPKRCRTRWKSRLRECAAPSNGQGVCVPGRVRFDEFGRDRSSRLGGDFGVRCIDVAALVAATVLRQNPATRK